MRFYTSLDVPALDGKALPVRRAPDAELGYIYRWLQVNLLMELICFTGTS